MILMVECLSIYRKFLKEFEYIIFFKIKMSSRSVKLCLFDVTLNDKSIKNTYDTCLSDTYLFPRSHYKSKYINVCTVILLFHNGYKEYNSNSKGRKGDSLWSTFSTIFLCV